MCWHTGCLLHILWREGIKPCRQGTELSLGRCLGSSPVAATGFLCGHRQAVLSKSTSLHLTIPFSLVDVSVTWWYSSWVFFWMCTSRRLCSVCKNLWPWVNPHRTSAVKLLQEKILTFKEVTEKSGRKAELQNGLVYLIYQVSNRERNETLACDAWCYWSHFNSLSVDVCLVPSHLNCHILICFLSSDWFYMFSLNKFYFLPLHTGVQLIDTQINMV